MKWKRGKYTSNRNIHILAGWKARNKWPSALPPVCGALLFTLLATSRSYWSKRGLKWTKTSLNPLIDGGKLSGAVVFHCTRMALARKPVLAILFVSVFLQVTPDWPNSWLRGCAVVKTCRFLLVGLILLLFSLKAFAQKETNGKYRL